MSKPVRLAKVEEQNICESIMMWIENWVLNHATLCLIVVTCLLVALFTVLIFALVGVSATESGMMRNFINGGQI